MLLMLVAAFLGVLGLSSIAGGVTLTAISHPVPGEVWTLAATSVGALAALLAGHAVATSSDTPPSLTRSPEADSHPSTVVNHVGPVGVDTSHLGPEAHEAAAAYLAGDATARTDVSKLPPPPHDRSQGRDSPPARTSKLPPRPRVAPKAKRPARTAKASARRR